MDEAVQDLVTWGLSSQSRASYRTGVNRFMGFCCRFSIPPFPLFQTNLCRFVAFLHAQNLSPSAIRVYLSGVRFYQIQSGGPDPSRTDMPQLHYVLRAIKRATPVGSRQVRLSITPSILHHLHSVWAASPVTYTSHMLWAACCLGFFAFLRSGEFTCPSARAYNGSMLSPADIVVDSRDHPTSLTVLLKASKTDVFQAGHSLLIGTTGDLFCPVAAILGYLAIRPDGPGPLFIYEDGTPLSRSRLVQAVRSALTSIGTIDLSRYTGHSFRIGAATTAARAGIPDSMIQTLGRWKSSSFLSYIRTQPGDTIAISRRLANQAAE